MSPTSQVHTPALLHDHPETNPDALWSGITTLSEQLVDLLDAWATDSHAPLLLSGSWGSGKTTLLRAVERGVVARHGERHTIWFDAWRCEGEGALLPALLRAVWEQLPEAVHESAEMKQRFVLMRHAAVVLASRAVGAAASSVPGLGAIAKAGFTTATLKKDLEALGAADVFEPAVDPTTVLVEQLERVVAAGWPADEGVAGPIVLIDDLDRCSPEGALDLLDQVRGLLAVASALGPSRPLRLRFVMAMDRDVLLRAVASKYRNLPDYDANRFLEKLFPVAFAVPAPTYRASAELVQQFLGDGALDRHVDALTVALEPGFFANPRLMKRCVNRFRLVAWFEARAGTAPTGHDDDRTLARWIAATERWPELRRLMRDHADDYWRALGSRLADDTAPMPGPDAARLLSSRGVRAWLRREVFAGRSSQVSAFRAAELRLQTWGL